MGYIKYGSRQCCYWFQDPAIVEILNQLDSVAMHLHMTSMLLKHILVITFAYGAKNVKSHTIGYRQTILTSVVYYWNRSNTKNALQLDILKFRNNIFLKRKF
jgi:hypothetical protein